MVEVAAGVGVYVGDDATVVTAASVSDADITDGMASSTTGGQIVMARMVPGSLDAAGSADPANNADHAALLAADV
jgi:hypothetical protein